MTSAVSFLVEHRGGKVQMRVMRLRCAMDIEYLGKVRGRSIYESKTKEVGDDFAGLLKRAGLDVKEVS